jgi:hypothetical protein
MEWKNYSYVSDIEKYTMTGDFYIGKGGVFTGSHRLLRRGDVVIPEGLFKAHTSILGATRSGKSVALKLLASQAIRKGYGLILIDFKPDFDLYRTVRHEAKAMGREDGYIFFSPNMGAVDPDNPGGVFPPSSATYNPLMKGSQEEIVSRVLRSISEFDKGSGGDRYWEDIKEDILDAIIGCLMGMDKPFNYADMWTAISSEDAMNYIIENTRNYQARAKLNEIYRQLTGEAGDRVRLQYKGTQVALGYYAISEVAPFLNSYEPAIDLHDVITRQQILHVALSQQLAQKTASGTAKLLLSDLNSVVGRILTTVGRLDTRFVVIIDEFGCSIFKGIEDLFNKSAGAGVSLVIAHQSLSDIDFKAGAEMRNIIMDNTRSKIYFSQTGSAGPKFFSEICGKCYRQKGKYKEYSVFNPFVFFERNVRQEETALVEPHYLTNLEDINFYAKVGDMVYRGVTPILPSLPDAEEPYHYDITKESHSAGLNLFNRFYKDSLGVSSEDLTPEMRAKIIKKKNAQLAVRSR